MSTLVACVVAHDLNLFYICSQDDDHDEHQLVEDFGFDEATIRRLGEEIEVGDLEQADPMLQALTALALCPAAVSLSSPPDTVYRCSNVMEAVLKAARAQLRKQNLTEQLHQNVAVEAADRSVDIQFDSAGRAVAAVVSMVPAPVAAPIAASQTIYRPGEAMPYVRLPEQRRPDVTVTVQLHGLSAEQEFAFRVIMNTMQQHLDGATDVPQLTMAILGNAGEFRCM